MRSGQPGINSKELGTLKINIPTIQEQTKIGLFFDKLDKLINLQQSKVNALKSLKNGYLQKLFVGMHSNTPQLRFKGFNDPWHNKKFYEILSVDGLRRGPFGSSIKKSDFVKDSEYTVYEQQNAIYNRFNTRYNITKNKYEELNKFHLNPGDFIMSGAGTIGKIAEVPKNIKKGVFNQALIRISLNENTDPDYFIQFMNSYLMQKELIGINPGSAMQNLRPMKEIKNINISIPAIEEQTNIGSFMASIDKQITSQEDKLNHLKATKRGFLQKLFV